MRPSFRSALTALALAASLWLGGGASAPFAWAAEQVSVRLEISTLAPQAVIDHLHAHATDDWLATLFPQFDPADRERIRLMAIERTPRGVRVRIEFKEDVKDPARFRVPLEAALEQLAKSLPRPYSYSLKEAPPPPEPPRIPWGWVGGAALMGVLLWLLSRRRPPFLSQPRFGGLPMAGLLPAGLGMGGKFLELQSAPCQAMGVMVRELTLAASLEGREIALASTGDPSALAVVTAALGISLVREGKRVLVMDFLGDDSVLAEVLEEADDEVLSESGDFATLRHTGIPDLDLMTALPWPEREDPLLPKALSASYDWTLMVLPEGRYLANAPTFPVFSGNVGSWAVWRERFKAWQRKSRLLGAILVGVPVSAEVRDRMLARSYFERIRRLEKTVT